MRRPNHATVAQGVFPGQYSYQEHLFVSAVIRITVGKLGTLGEVASLAVLCARGLAAESEVESLSTDGVDEFVGSAVEQLPLIHITGPLLHAHLLSFAVNQAFQFSESLFAYNKCHDKSLLYNRAVNRVYFCIVIYCNTSTRIAMCIAICIAIFFKEELMTFSSYFIDFMIDSMQKNFDEYIHVNLSEHVIRNIDCR